MEKNSTDRYKIPYAALQVKDIYSDIDSKSPQAFMAAISRIFPRLYPPVYPSITKTTQRNLLFDQSQICRRFPATVDVQLIQNVVDVVLDRPNLDHQTFRDLLIGAPCADQF